MREAHVAGAALARRESFVSFASPTRPSSG
jgi:hypothetical protein